MNSSIGIYRYHNVMATDPFFFDTFLTGTDDQPDTLTIFVKSSKNSTSFSACHLHAPANLLGCIPVVSTFTAIVRIVNSVKTIFKELGQIKFKANDPHLNKCWMAFKNLFRGILELIPVIGNLTLIFYDTMRNVIIFDAAIVKAIAEKENIAGIAMDGKVIFTVNLDLLKTYHANHKIILKDNDEIASAFPIYCSSFLKTVSEKKCPLKMIELLPKIKLLIEEDANKSINAPSA